MAALLLHTAQALPLPSPSPLCLHPWCFWESPPSVFLLCRDHEGSRCLLLSACGVFFLLNLPEGIDVLKGLMAEMSVNPLNWCL